MNEPVTLENLALLSIRASDAGQEKLAGILCMITEALDESDTKMTIDGLFGAMLCYRRRDFEVESKEHSADWRTVGR